MYTHKEREEVFMHTKEDIVKISEENLDIARNELIEAIEFNNDFLLDECEDLNDVNEILNIDDLVFNDKYDHVLYDNAESKIYFNRILRKILKGNSSKHALKQQYEAVIKFIRREKRKSKEIIQNETEFIEECNALISLIDELRGKNVKR